MVEQLLEVRKDQLANDDQLAGWPSWNLARQQARDPLDVSR